MGEGTAVRMHFYEGADERAHVTMKLTLPPKLLAAPCVKLLSVFAKARRNRSAPPAECGALWLQSRSGAAIPPDTSVSELLGSLGNDLIVRSGPPADDDDDGAATPTAATSTPPSGERQRQIQTRKVTASTNYIFATIPSKKNGASPSAGSAQTEEDARKRAPDWTRCPDIFGFPSLADRREFFERLRAYVVQELGGGSTGAEMLGRAAEAFERLAACEAVEREVWEHDANLGMQAAIYYLGGISNRPLVENEALGDADGSFGWLVRLREHWREIRDELNGALADAARCEERGVRVWAGNTYGNDCPDASAVPDAWKNWHLIEHGRWVDENAALLPRTAARLRECGADLVADEVMIARQPPRTGIDPHSDGKNFMLAAHIGLVVPPDQVCWMRVGAREHRWAAGRACVINSSFLHQTWNGSHTDERFVLILRFWHPEVTLCERAALQYMLTASDTYMSTRVRSGAAAAQAQAREAYATWEHKAAPPRAAASAGASHYETLGVARDASAAHIKRRYRALMLKFHPDKHRGDDAVVAGAAAARTARISAAYEVLRDPALRELYDMEFR